MGISPPFVAEKITRYLGTLRLEDAIDVSLFTTFDYERQVKDFDFFKTPYRLFDETSRFVQFVVHAPVPEVDESSPLRDERPSLGLVFGQITAEPVSQETLDVQEYEDHKIGGVPCFYQLEGDYAKASDLLDQGYVHILQLSELSHEDSLTDGDWPFGPWFFHVFAKKGANGFEFRYLLS